MEAVKNYGHALKFASIELSQNWPDSLIVILTFPVNFGFVLTNPKLALLVRTGGYVIFFIY
jgi:hypothetical protein